ncbi:transposase [Candidatus Bathyarchaeota archaeon]|nr:transposase [Candidatus Bathyarchaeota archaeon]
MNECRALHDLFQAVDLDFVEQALERSYGRRRTGRHPRSLFGQFKTELLKRVARIEGYDELHRLLQNDEDLRMLCDVKEGEKSYHPSILSRFRKRIGPEAFQEIMAHCVKQLARMNILDARTVALDATFIKAYSRRDPKNSRRGLSDIEAGLRKQGRKRDAWIRRSLGSRHKERDASSSHSGACEREREEGRANAPQESYQAQT